MVKGNLRHLKNRVLDFSDVLSDSLYSDEGPKLEASVTLSTLFNDVMIVFL